MINPVVRLLLIAVLLAPIPALAAADQAHTQFCWTIGKFEISGIDHHEVKCNTSDLTSFRLTRPALVRDWLESEFEVVNTTFLSDLDY